MKNNDINAWYENAGEGYVYLPDSQTPKLSTLLSETIDATQVGFGVAVAIDVQVAIPGVLLGRGFVRREDCDRVAQEGAACRAPGSVLHQVFRCFAEGESSGEFVPGAFRRAGANQVGSV